MEGETVNWRSSLEDWLMLLLWEVDPFSRPTIGSLLNPPQREIPKFTQLRRLEKRGLLRQERRADKMIWRLTESGRQVALGGRDPVAEWSRPWDGRWRLVMFDLPVGRQVTRQRLLRWLRGHGFGYLQNSVWISPDPVLEVIEAMKEFRDVESFSLMEAQCIAGHTDADLVSGAWDFAEINRRYQDYLDWMRKVPAANAPLAPWLRAERQRWRRVLEPDPLLPRTLWPRAYDGEAAFRRRQTVFRELASR
jgi:phenylacetic acid degradation operon negative regulatory protein